MAHSTGGSCRKSRCALLCMLLACAGLLQGCLECSTESSSPLCSLLDLFVGRQARLVGQLRALVGPVMEQAGLTEQEQIWEILGKSSSDLLELTQKAEANPSEAVGPVLEAVKPHVVTKIMDYGSSAMKSEADAKCIAELLSECHSQELIQLLQAAMQDPLSAPAFIFSTVSPVVLKKLTSGKVQSWEAAERMLRPVGSLLAPLSPQEALLAVGIAFTKIVVVDPLVLAVPVAFIALLISFMSSCCTAPPATTGAGAAVPEPTVTPATAVSKDCEEAAAQPADQPAETDTAADGAQAAGNPQDEQ